MKTGLPASFCLIVCFLVCSSEAQTNVTAELGQDVILPCKVPNNYNINIRAVEWSRPGLDPEYVLFYRDGHLDPYNQHPSYKNRVDLKDKDMKDGDVSMILKNVMKNDTGRYECRVFEEGKIDPINIINLVVYLPGQKNIGAEKITAELGQDVILPCKVPNNINIIAVEWSRPGLHPDHVLVYRDGHLDPDNQHPSYQNRVDLQDKDMKDGDFSLILKNVTKNDNGTYECHVLQKGSYRNKRSNLGYDPINTIILEVHLSGNKEGMSGDRGDKDGRNKARVIVVSAVMMILLLAVVVGFLINRRQMRQNSKLPSPTDEAAAEQMLQNKDMKVFPDQHQQQPQLV